MKTERALLVERALGRLERITGGVCIRTCHVVRVVRHIIRGASIHVT